MEKIILRPKFFRTVISSVSVFIMILLTFTIYLWLTGEGSLSEYVDISLIAPIAGHLIGTILGFKKHADLYSITISKEGIEGPENKLFSKAERKLVKYAHIEKVTNIGRPRWLFTSKIVTKHGAKISIDWGVTDSDYRLILTTLENHYVKVSDYVWQIYTDR